MNAKKNVICKKDYERYSVKVPFRVFLSRNRSRNRYLFGELEKLHPCFSDECSFDSKMKLSKKGFVSDVVVMNSLKLSEYKTRFLGKRLFLEENPGKCVFKKVGNWKLAGIGALAVFAGSLAVFTGTFRGTASGSEVARTVEGGTETVEADSSSFESQSGIWEGRLPCELTDYFLSMIEGDSAFLSEFEWKCDGMNESFFASVGYIHPERLMKTDDFELSSVTYRENMPFFTVKGKSRVRKNDMNKTEFVWTNGNTGLFEADEEAFSGLREIISLAGAEFLEEKFHPWKIRFVLKNATLDGTESLISQMADFVIKQGIAIRRLVIRKGGFDDFELELETAPDLEPYMGVNLSVLEKRFRLFGLKNKTDKVQSYQISVGKNEIDSAVNILEQDKIRRIGEIRHKDGSFVVYFKNQQGKIVSEMRK